MLGGSWVVINWGYKSPGVMTIVTLIITPLITTHGPPSGDVSSAQVAHLHLGPPLHPNEKPAQGSLGVGPRMPTIGTYYYPYYLGRFLMITVV